MLNLGDRTDARLWKILDLGDRIDTVDIVDRTDARLWNI